MVPIDSLTTKTYIDGKWVVARPVKDPPIQRLKDAIQVILGKADAVKYYKQ